MDETIPFLVPDDLLEEVRATADQTQMSMQEVLRQSTKLGLPKLKEQLAHAEGRLTNVDPLPDAVLERLYRERDEDDATIRCFITAQPKDADWDCL